MLYLHPIKHEMGAYPPPQTSFSQLLLQFPDELLEEFNSYAGFVDLEVSENTVTKLIPNTEAFEKWQKETGEQGAE